MSYTDIITNKQKVVKIFSEKEVEEILTDENHRIILQFLFKGPLTIEDLQIAYNNIGSKKSDKSIYRYLGILKRAGLVIEACKRIYSDKDNQIKTQTLFSRVAKIIFTPYKRLERQEELENKTYEILNIILQEKLGLKKASSDSCLKTKVDKLYNTKNESIANYFENIKNEKILNLIEDFEIQELYPILDLASWIILFEEHPETIKDFIKCFK